jgi:hypothetical protein
MGDQRHSRTRGLACGVLWSVLAGLVAAPPAAAQSDPSFFVVNNSPQSIVYIYVSASSANKWGQDQ